MIITSSSPTTRSDAGIRRAVTECGAAAIEAGATHRWRASERRKRYQSERREQRGRRSQRRSRPHMRNGAGRGQAAADDAREAYGTRGPRRRAARSDAVRRWPRRRRIERWPNSGPPPRSRRQHTSYVNAPAVAEASGDARDERVGAVWWRRRRRRFGRRAVAAARRAAEPTRAAEPRGARTSSFWGADAGRRPRSTAVDRSPARAPRTPSRRPGARPSTTRAGKPRPSHRTRRTVYSRSSAPSILADASKAAAQLAASAALEARRATIDEARAAADRATSALGRSTTTELEATGSDVRGEAGSPGGARHVQI